MIRSFNRWELKYVVKCRARDALLPIIQGHMSPDREGRPDGVYRVTSLYWDTQDYHSYRAKLDGINFRRKLRIRRYGALETQCAAAMVEIKQRINRATQKRRVSLSYAEAFALCEGTMPARVGELRDRQVAEEVVFLSGAQQLRPACVVSYERRAFVGSAYEPGLRITFDRDLCVGQPGGGLGPLRGARRFLPADVLILEVKSNEVVPLWVSRMLAAEGCALVRYSKYCSGLARLGGRCG